MPFVDANVHTHLPRKRRWQGDTSTDDTHGIYRPDQPDDIFILNPDEPGTRSRKIASFSKRPRILNSNIGAVTDGNNVDPAQHPSRRKKGSIIQQQEQQQNSTDSRPPLLAPCHVCHRRPTKKSHLDSFADCQGCGERTCFVCIRECQRWAATDEVGGASLEEEEMLSRSFQMEDFTPDTYTRSITTPDAEIEFRQSQKEVQTQGQRGWHARGHQSVICSRCCVERGTEGDVVCLGCLSGMDGV